MIHSEASTSSTTALWTRPIPGRWALAWASSLTCSSGAESPTLGCGGERVDLSPAPEAEVGHEGPASRSWTSSWDLTPTPHSKKWISLQLHQRGRGEAAARSRQICAFSEVLPVLMSTQGPSGARISRRLRHSARAARAWPGCEMKPRAGTEIRFSRLPTQMFPAGATPAEITRHSMDLSYALETVLNFGSSPPAPRMCSVRREHGFESGPGEGLCAERLENKGILFADLV